MSNIMQTAKHAFIKMWDARDELSFHNLRLEKWPVILLFPLAIILSDLRFLDQDMEFFGLDSVLLIMLAYSLGWLVCAFLPSATLFPVLRAAALVALASLLPQFFGLPAEPQLMAFLAFHFAIGICVACGFYAFMFSLHNAERFFIMGLIVFYYALIDMLWQYDSVSDFLKTIGSAAVMLAFLVVVFCGKKDALPPRESRPADKSRGGYIVFFIYIVYFIIDLTNIYIDYEEAFTEDWLLGIGGLLAILVAYVVQMIFNKSVWHLWNLFLILSVVGSALLLVEGTLQAGTGSLLYGAAGSIGYFAVLYMMGGAGKRNGSLLFFRVACGITFLNNSVFAIGFDAIFASLGIEYNVISFAVILILTSICMLLIPVLSRKLFESDWSDEYRHLHMPEYAEQATKVHEYDRLDQLGLTPREKEILSLLLTDKPPKQIGSILKISMGTVNFHSNNLYRKLEIQSRAELFAGFAHMVSAEEEPQGRLH